MDIGEKLVLPQLAVPLGLSNSDFRVEAVLSGGMGVCCKLVHIKDGRPYALKMMKTLGSLGEVGYRRFLNELKLWSTASACDGVVEAYSIFSLNELPCVCARWMPGGDLYGRLLDRSPELFYRTMDRLVAILDWVYGEYKIIHLDLKPGNILFDENSRPSIADWGIARLSHEASAFVEGPTSAAPKHPNLVRTGEFIGTIPYSSPEQILGRREIDHRADIYSLGCIMFEWETGQFPFLGSTPEEIAHKHLQITPPRLGGLFRKTNFGAENTIRRCLHKTPTDRFQDYTELRNVLRSDARARGIDLNSNYNPQRRYKLPLVGSRDIIRRGLERAIKAGDHQYAVAEYDELGPYVREADILCGLGEWGKAAEILNVLYVPEAFARFPDFPFHLAVATNLGSCLVHLGRAPDAIKVFKTVAHARDKPAEFYVNLSFALLDLDLQVAERIAREGLRAYPNDEDLLGNLTVACLRQSKLADARGFAEKRLALSRNIHSLDEAAIVEMALGRTTEDRDYPGAATHFFQALGLLTEASRLNPGYLPARFNLARVWFKLGEYARSTEELGEIPWDPAYAEIWATQMAECMDRLAMFKECQEFCDKWLAKLPNSVALRRVRAENMADWFIGKEEDGVRIIDRAAFEFFMEVVKRPNERTASDLIYLARIKEWMGKIGEAVSLFGEAESLQPENWEGPYCRALTHWHLNEFDDALVWARHSCALAPWQPKTWRALSLVQKSMGLLKESAENAHQAAAIRAKREELTKAITSHTIY